MGKMILVATCMMLAFSKLYGCDGTSKEKAGSTGYQMSITLSGSRQLPCPVSPPTLLQFFPP